MADSRDVLDLLRFELRFLRDGGYGRSPHAPQRKPLILEDSLSCMNFNSQADRQPCTSCLLMQYVPPDRILAEVPCRHIPLNAAGQTLASLYESGTQQEIEEAVECWLRDAIRHLEAEKAATA
jgi:hypothetical protein